MDQKDYITATFEYFADSEKAVRVCQTNTQDNVHDLEDEDEASIDDDQLKDFYEEFQTNPVLSQLQHQCPDFASIFSYKKDGPVPDNHITARKVVAEAFNYEIRDGILCHIFQRRFKNKEATERLVFQVAVPQCLRHEVLLAYHDSKVAGHQGHERTYEAVRSKYYWPRMYQEIKDYVQGCEICQQTIRHSAGRPTPLNPMPVEDVFSRWHMDILGGLPTTTEKYKYILLVVNSASKWCEALPLKTQAATEIANVLFKEIFTRYGIRSR
ncbi:protein NYNRIN-like [Pecten maximus]|uniref:protein NYNRIN-like n=1 Tax=Pecten maximus TaxID=6579 RepID=UPI001458C2D6|nr:protein NYNRIN-like [Pecten maximus]